MSPSSELSLAKCTIQVVCDRSWSDFHVTELSGARFCDHCEKLVFYASNHAEVRIAAEKNLCVYIPASSNFDNSLKLLQLTRQGIRNAEAQVLKNLKQGLIGQVVVRSSVR